MQALFVTIIVLVALAILVPMMFMVGALFRTVVATFRAHDDALASPARSGNQEGGVDSLASSLRRGEAANADADESIEGMGGPTSPGGP